MVGWLIRAACIALCPVLPALAAPPERVVSMNLCTDQLAMMLAAPGQLLSVSYLARDARSSAMVDEAQDFPVNHGLAEEIYRLRPDLVLAGAYTTATTVALLRRLGVPVAIFQPEQDLDGIRASIRQMGAALGRVPEAEAMVAAFDRDLAALTDQPGTRPRAAIYHANGYSAGTSSLSGQILEAAGLRNVAAEAGISGGGILALERLVLAHPDILIRGNRFPGASRAEEILDHPALLALTRQAGSTAIADRDWVCGTPHVLGAITTLREARKAVTRGHDDRDAAEPVTRMPKPADLPPTGG